MTGAVPDVALELRGVSRHYGGKDAWWRRVDPVRAVDGVDLVLRSGETLGIVGESGSGKSTLGRIAAGIEAPSAGSVSFRGEPYAAIGSPAWRRQRRHVQVVFQNPSQALDPRLSIAAQVREPMPVRSRPCWRGSALPGSAAASRTSSPAASCSAPSSPGRCRFRRT
jgi:ABC-type glutathione transport system ATPase component